MSHLRPAALPDEFVSGYEGRLLRFNGWTDRKVVMQTLLTWSGRFGAPRREVSTVVELLAEVAGIESSQFVRQHTLIPLRRAVTSSMQVLQHGSPDNGAVLRAMAMRAIRPGAYFCRRCVEEDLDFHGTPYWRRGHQLPGVFWCSKHGGALSYVEPKSAFASSPTAFLAQGHPISERWVDSLKGCEPIPRFEAICTDLLARTQPLDQAAVSKAARARALEMGLDVKRSTVRQRRLSDLIKHKFDKNWLDSIIPGLTEKPTGVYWPTIDDALRGKWPNVASVVFALTFSVLFESADAAVNAMVGSSISDPQAGTEARPKKAVSDEDLRAAFIASRGNHSAAAAKLVLRRDEAKRRLTKLGLPSLHRVEAQELNAVISAVLMEDMPLSEACHAAGVSRASVVAALHQAVNPIKLAMVEMIPSRIRRNVMAKAQPLPPPRQPGRMSSSEAARPTPPRAEASHRSVSTA